MKEPDFDIQSTHRYFSAHCFNSAWELMDKSSRTKEEDEQMIRLNQASTWHWTQRSDCIPRNLSIGYWQASRILAILGDAEKARKYGGYAYDHSTEDEPFYRGYAYEALARAEAVAGNKEKCREYLDMANGLAEKVSDADEKKMLLDDLKTI